MKFCLISQLRMLSTLHDIVYKFFCIIIDDEYYEKYEIDLFEPVEFSIASR